MATLSLQHKDHASENFNNTMQANTSSDNLFFLLPVTPSAFKAMPPLLKPPKPPKNEKSSFLHKWVQICLKLMKIINFAPKVGFMGQKMTIMFRKSMSADMIFRLFWVTFSHFVDTCAPQQCFLVV